MLMRISFSQSRPFGVLIAARFGASFWRIVLAHLAPQAVQLIAGALPLPRFGYSAHVFLEVCDKSSVFQSSDLACSVLHDASACVATNPPPPPLGRSLVRFLRDKMRRPKGDQGVVGGGCVGIRCSKKGCADIQEKLT